MRYQIEVNLLADDAWALVGERFGDTGQWTSLLDASELVGGLEPGGKRLCKIGNKKLVETITHYDAATRVVEYELTTGRPAIVASARNTWRVLAAGSSQALVVMEPQIELRRWAFAMQPLMRWGLNSSLTKVLEEFKYWAETGEVHPVKRAQISKLS
jgi:hypothetical protein